MLKYKLILYEFIVIAYILIVPYAYHIDLGPGPNSIVAMLWELRFETPEAYFIFIRPLWFYEIYSIVRFLFLIVTCVFIYGKLSVICLIISGFIVDLSVLLISIPGMYLLNSDGENLLPILIPIPTLFLLVLLIAFISFKVKSHSKQLEIDAISETY